jgi:hypothetical protein
VNLNYFNHEPVSHRSRPFQSPEVYFETDNDPHRNRCINWYPSVFLLSVETYFCSFFLRFMIQLRPWAGAQHAAGTGTGGEAEVGAALTYD